MKDSALQSVSERRQASLKAFIITPVQHPMDLIKTSGVKNRPRRFNKIEVSYRL
jgi:hypothetical protein